MKKLYFTVAELAARWKLTNADVAILGAEGVIPFGVFVDHAQIDFERVGQSFRFTDARVCSFTITGYVPITPSAVASHMVKRPRVPIGIDKKRIYQSLKDVGHFKEGPAESDLIDDRTSAVFGESIFDKCMEDEEFMRFKLMAKAADVMAYENNARDDADEGRVLRVLGALLSLVAKTGKTKQAGIVTDLVDMKINGLGKTTIDTVFASANRAFKAIE